MKHYLYNTFTEQWETVTPESFPSAFWEKTRDFSGVPCMIAYNVTTDGEEV